MVFGYKHFSHTHKLVMHDLPEGAEVTCSGCNSLAKNTIYICWQCNFVLHVLCYQATRSKKHPSHPEHSLTLVPYPTYPSNSFYCNSCKIVGTGFSYSCADCEFDLHVQCAYSISDATNHPITSPHPHNTSHLHQETMPPNMMHNGQYTSMVPNFASISIANQIPTSPPAPSPPPASVPVQVHAQYPIVSPHYHNVSYQNQEPVQPYMHGHNSSVPAQYSTIISQDSYTTQHSTQFSVPTSSPNPNISLQNAYASQHFTSVPPSPQNSSTPPNNTYIVPPSAPNEHPSHMTLNTTSYPIPTTTQNAYSSQNFTSLPPSPHNSSTAPNNTYAFVPPSAPNEHPPQDSYTTQNAYVSQNLTSRPPSPQISSKHDNNTNVVPPNVPNEQVSHYVNANQNKPKNLGIKHFSHPHGLVKVNLKRGKKQIACSGCEETLVGKGYACVEENCGFQLDESCFNLEKEIQHKSHPPHKLTLLSKSPYQNHDTFICSACFEVGSGFTYHCSICEFDLHVKCANLKETVKRDDHDHELKLFYECPLKGDEYTFYCDACNRVVHRDHWTYYCKECDYGTHLNCVDREICNEESDHEERVETLAEVMESHRIQAICRQNAIDNI
ncbi:uncharacterized protein [Rutidosis leptorrhynchoides]|uniref:uncharacterized protein n=1 Tax=Rutidosis leptorrhynchoides TaxID=125765 RepID=UPI003A992040